MSKTFNDDYFKNIDKNEKDTRAGLTLLMNWQKW